MQFNPNGLNSTTGELDNTSQLAQRVALFENPTNGKKMPLKKKFYAFLYRLGERSFYVTISFFFLMALVFTVGFNLSLIVALPFYMPIILGVASAIISCFMWRAAHAQYDTKDQKGRQLIRVKFLIRISIMIPLALGAYLSVPIVMIAGFFLWGVGVVWRYALSWSVNNLKHSKSYSRHWFFSLFFIILELALPVMLGLCLMLPFTPMVLIILSGLVLTQLLLVCFVPSYNDLSDIPGVGVAIPARARFKLSVLFCRAKQHCEVEQPLLISLNDDNSEEHSEIFKCMSAKQN